MGSESDNEVGLSRVTQLMVSGLNLSHRGRESGVDAEPQEALCWISPWHMVDVTLRQGARRYSPVLASNSVLP